MNISLDFKENLIDILKENLKVVYLTSGGKELVIRCPYCGDSSKSEVHAHLYIKMNDDHAFPFYCQKCMASGLLDKNLLKDLGINNYELSSNLTSINKEAKTLEKRYRKNLNDNFSIRKLNTNKLIIPEYTNKSKKKLDYLNSRFSFNLTPEEYINNYKVIFSFKDFLLKNEIEYIMCSDYMLKKLIKGYVGFLSADYNYIIFRNIEPNCEKKYRYYNYQIFDYDNSNKFYIVKDKINLLQPKIDVVLTEGIFDIIGVKEYFFKDAKNTIFSAVCGKGYNLVLNYLSRLGFMDMNIHIFSDGDVPIEKYKAMIKYSNAMKNNRITIYYNSIEKDYGIKLDRIKLKSRIINR